MYLFNSDWMSVFIDRVPILNQKEYDLTGRGTVNEKVVGKGVAGDARFITVLAICKEEEEERQ